MIMRVKLMELKMIETIENLIKEYKETIDVCKKRVDAYYSTLQSIKKLGFKTAYIAIPDEALKSKLVVRSSLSIDGVSNKVLSSSTIGDMVESESFKEMKTIYIESFENSKFQKSDLLKSISVNSIISTPISYKKEALGVIVTILDEVDFKEVDLEAIERVASILGSNLHRLTNEISNEYREDIKKSENNFSEEIADAFQVCLNTVDMKDLSKKVLNYVRGFTGSEFGFVGYIEQESGHLVIPTMTEDIFPICRVDGKTTVFEKAGGVGGFVIDKKEPVIANEPYKHPSSVGTPPGHVPIRKFLGVPCIYKDEVVGMIALANKIDDYNSYDLNIAKSFASIYSAAIGKLFSDKSLNRAKNRFMKLYDDAPCIYYTIEPNGVIKEINQTALKLFQLSKDKVINKLNIDYFLSEAGAKLYQSQIKELTKENSAKSFEVDFSCRADSKMSVINSISGNFDERGFLVDINCTAVDITERKRAENALNSLNIELESRVKERTEELEESLQKLKKAQKQLIESEKMASLGALVAGVAHEINTPIGIGVTAISYLESITNKLEKLFRDEDLAIEDLEEFLENSHETIESITINLKRSSELIKSFKKVAVDQSQDEVQNFYILNYLNEILLSMHNRLKRTKYRVQINCAEDFLVKNYSGALFQIITNLVMNSLTHGFKDRKLGVISIDVSLDRESVFIIYRDDGVGISQKNLKSIFEPFFTTNREVGTGLGLHIVYNLVVHKLKGEIECDSKEGEGVEFKLRFPKEI